MEAEALFLRVPRKRIGALIGPGGSAKRAIEEKTGARIEVDSDTGEVNIVPGEDALAAHKAAEAVKAIARGFSPHNAMRVLEGENALRVFSLREAVGKRPRAIHTQKARLIGEGGRVRRKLEEETGCRVSVYGNTVALIGGPAQLQRAEQAVQRILDGASIKAVYAYLERKPKSEKPGFEL